MLRAPVGADVGLTTFSARDEFNQTAGDLATKTAPVGGTWAGAGDADDFSIETTGKTAQRTSVSDAGGTGRYAISGAAAVAAQVVQINFKYTSATFFTVLVQQLVARYTDTSNWLRAGLVYTNPNASIGLTKNVAGVAAAVSPGVSISLPASDSWNSLRLLVDVSGRAFVWFYPTDGVLGDPVLIGQHPDLATGGALASGKIGFYDEHSDAAALTRNYDNFAAWVPNTDAVLHASQSAELRTDGMFREDASGAAYGPVSHAEGKLPRMPVGGTAEFFLKASRGDFDRLPDSGIDDMSARVFYRPSWLFVPGS